MAHPAGRIDLRANIRNVPPHIPPAVHRATTRLLGTRANVVSLVGDERWQELRQAGHDVRAHTIAHLDHYLALLEQRVTEAGGHVHWARDGEEANRIVLEIAAAHGVKRAVKAKSMASEEIELNQALIAAGIEAVETDLGEFIVQLAGVAPSHIIAPAVHLTKEGIADLFRNKLGIDAEPDPLKLTAIARGHLRNAFLAADMGISGANFMVAETGTIVLVTNEGNGRMCTTLPRLHVAIAGIDKVVPDMESAATLLKLLPRSATGQKMTCYTSFITGPRGTAGEGGPEELHLVLLDNGRTRVLADPIARDTLLCIRCGACLNICPVYNHIGGHAYGTTYSGPIGAILSPQLLGVKIAGDLPFASSLCGACAEICPVKIPILEILIHLRRRVVEGDAIEPPAVSPVLTVAATVGSFGLSSPLLYRFGSQALRFLQAPFRRGGWLVSLPPPFDRWTAVRPLPAFDGRFHTEWQRRTPAGRSALRRRRAAGLIFGASLIAALVAFVRRRRSRRFSALPVLIRPGAGRS